MDLNSSSAIMDKSRLPLLRMKRLPVYRKFKYTPSPSDRLSRCLSALSHLVKSYEMDMLMDGSGDCGRIIADSHSRHANRIARSHGFDSVEQVCTIAEKRVPCRKGYPHPSVSIAAFFIQ